jgi:hypothetical protein
MFISKTPYFIELLRLIDQADSDQWRKEDRLEALTRFRCQSDTKRSSIHDRVNVQAAPEIAITDPAASSLRIG